MIHKVKIRVMLTEEALMMATKLQDQRIKPLSHIVEDCIRSTYEQQQQQHKLKPSTAVE